MTFFWPLVILDLSAVFDVKEVVLHWYELYLSDIFQFVHVNGKSSLHTIKLVMEIHRVLCWDQDYLHYTSFP